MPTVKFDTGQTVNFDSTPSPQDIEEVANKLGINSPQQPTTTPQKSGILPVGQGKNAMAAVPSAVNSAGQALSKVFPGGQLGKDLGTSAVAISQLAKAGGQAISGNETGAKQTFNTALNTGSSIQPTRDLGDAANIGATVGLPAVGGETALGRIGANAAIGAGIGGANAVAQGQNVSSVAKNTALGGVLGGGLSAAGEGIASLAKNLPNWFIQKSLPKLNPENTNFALQKLDASSVKSNSIKAAQAVNSSGKTIDSILSHPQYTEEIGNLKSVIPSVTKAFPNSGLSTKTISSELQSLAPKNALLVKKVLDGTANLAEQNTLRQELDRAVYPSIADKINPKLTFTKQIGKTIADALRSNVQTTAPETVPAFEQFSKEINLSNALKVAQAKIQKGSGVSMYDIIAAAGGGLPSVIAERAARSASVGIMAAKGINNAAQSQILPVVGKALKAPLIKAVTN